MRMRALLPLLVMVAMFPVSAFGEPGKAVAVPPSHKGEDAGPVAPKRAKVTCAQYRAAVEKTAKHATFDIRIKPGSWGHIPPELHKLPRGAKLCGADSMGQIVVASPLFGKDIEAYYGPLLAKVGFQSMTCKVEPGRTRCSGKRHRDIGVIVTDQDSEVFVLSIIRR